MRSLHLSGFLSHKNIVCPCAPQIFLNLYTLAVCFDEKSQPASLCIAIHSSIACQTRRGQEEPDGEVREVHAGRAPWCSRTQIKEHTCPGAALCTWLMSMSARGKSVILWNPGSTCTLWLDTRRTRARMTCKLRDTNYTFELKWIGSKSSRFLQCLSSRVPTCLPFQCRQAVVVPSQDAQGICMLLNAPVIAGCLLVVSQKMYMSPIRSFGTQVLLLGHWALTLGAPWSMSYIWRSWNNRAGLALIRHYRSLMADCPDER